MDCNKCHDLLSDLLDNTLTGDDRRLLDAHFEECVICTDAHADLDSLIALARRERDEHAMPPSGEALWLRIREHVEEDMQWAREARLNAANSNARINTPQGRWWSRLWNAHWEFSAPQVVGTFATFVGIATLAAAFGTRVLRQPATEAQMAAPSGVISSLVSADSSVAPAERINFNEYVRRQQSDIEYWRQRVEENKNRLPPRMLESLDRTLVRLDQDVNYSLDELSRNPHDEVSEQMLNRALQDKIEILREISSEF
jgi:hypothetical protein